MLYPQEKKKTMDEQRHTILNSFTMTILNQIFFILHFKKNNPQDHLEKIHILLT